ncbi:beta-1,6-N-acetylglucosaminyltransferase [Sediminibacterium ginsengisoli]|uniref:Peptide O-xylosyltransferase n=1 Tax=Sediminibacterium ginsengisoli TaxID=413434 RepID=A0A1T4RN74_9BACT|nr:beta-1,6-N-acetylglucosaminyltransferase [Sediminibacterium ginsengisoli]SKA17246.1 Core-2/I-Branching enzyme [Sediminibacterium ginsengisoli]
MQIAYLIITYTDPVQTGRMIGQLSDANTRFYIHLDKKVAISAHAALQQHPQVTFVEKRVNVRWAGYSTVQAIFNGIEAILTSGISFDYICLLSGQDYPIKTPAEISGFFEQHKGKLFLKYRAFAGDWEEAFERISKYHLIDYRFPGKFFTENLINRLLPAPERPAGMQFYGSSMFWAISPQAADYVWKKIEQEPGLKRFFRYTWGPDEFLFQTILLNSEFSDLVVNSNCHYYKHKPLTPNPEWLGMQDLADLKLSDKLFARKFSIKKDAAILDAIDGMLTERKTVEN